MNFPVNGGDCILLLDTWPIVNMRIINKLLLSLKSLNYRVFAKLPRFEVQL